MKNIKDLLQKYSNFGAQEKEQKNKIISIFKKYQIEIDKKDFEIKNKILTVKISGSRKTEIILNKKNVLREIGDGILDIN